MGHVHLLKLLLPASIALAGCRSLGDYWTARGLDLWDCVPTAVFHDEDIGFNVSARATLFAQTGVGFYGLDNKGRGYGMALGRWGPVWREGGYHVIPIGSLEYQELLGENWPGGPDGRNLHRGEKLIRQSGNLFIILPMRGMTHPPSPGFAIFPDWYSVLDSDVSLVLGWFGVRIGFAPAQVVDFLVGLFTVDLLGDDGVPEQRKREHTAEDGV